MFKYVFSIALLISLSAGAMNNQLALVHPQATFIPEKHGNMVVAHDGSDFSLLTQDKCIPIQRAFVDKSLRGMSTESLSKILAADTYLKVKELDNNEFGIELKQRLNGGGLFGAWLGSTLGYGAVFFGGQAVIYGTTFWCPPLYTTAVKMTAIPLHNAACAAGVASGIALGSATGPV